MGRRATPSLALSATVRAWFGLTQVELGRALGVSQALVTKAEAHTRHLPPAAAARLEALALLGPGLADPPPPAPLALTPLLAPAEEAPLPPSPGPLTPAEQQELRRRLARLEREAYRLRVAFAEAHPRRALVAARWAAALPALQAALPFPASGPAPVPAPPAVWLAAHAARQAAPPPPHTRGAALAVARQALRLHLLTREIGVLRAWLAAGA